MSSSGRRTTRLDPDELAALEEQRDFLLRSIPDLEREHDAGDLDDADYAALRDDYTSRAADTLRAIEEQRSLFEEAKRNRSWGRRLALIGGVTVFAVIAGFLVAGALGAREAGDTASGGINARKSPSQRAQACQELLSPNAPEPAIECYQGVLDDDPKNAVALTWFAWQLELSAPSLTDEEAVDNRARVVDLLDQAVLNDPTYSYARAFRAVVAYRHGRFDDAEQYLADFRAGSPSPDAEAVIDDFGLDQAIADGPAGACIQSLETASPIESLKCFQTVVNADPKDAVALSWLAWQLELTSDYLPEADIVAVQASVDRYLEQAVEYDPDYSFARGFRAVVAYRRGLFEEAEQYLKDFRATDPPPEARDLIDQLDLERLIDEALAGNPAGDPFAPTTTTPN